MKTSWQWATLKNGFQETTIYRWDFILDTITSTIVPAGVSAVIWYSTFILGKQETIAGFTYHQMIHYTLVSMLFSQIRGGNHDFTLQEMIRTGQLSGYLVRPVGVVQFVYLRGLAPKLLICSFNLLLGMIVAVASNMEMARLLAAFFLALVGNIIHYQIGAILATFAFYWEEAYVVLMIKNMLVGFLSGEIIALHVFPSTWSWVWKAFPFFLYVYGPTQTALGAWSWMQYLGSMGLALVWIVLLSLGIRWSWKLGLRRYSSLGG